MTVILDPGQVAGFNPTLLEKDCFDSEVCKHCSRIVSIHIPSEKGRHVTGAKRKPEGWFQSTLPSKESDGLSW